MPESLDIKKTKIFRTKGTKKEIIYQNKQLFCEFQFKKYNYGILKKRKATKMLFSLVVNNIFVAFIN